jgi:hypothetical protein
MTTIREYLEAHEEDGYIDADALLETLTDRNLEQFVIDAAMFAAGDYNDGWPMDAAIENGQEIAAGHEVDDHCNEDAADRAPRWWERAIPALALATGMTATFAPLLVAAIF